MKANFIIVTSFVVMVLMILSCNENSDVIVKENNPLIGAWNWSQNSNEFSLGYTFSENTFICFESHGNCRFEIAGTYMYKNDTIILAYKPEEYDKYKEVWQYLKNENKMLIGGIEYIKSN